MALLWAKHGSRSVTSKSGSADMFEKLGVRLDLSIENSARLLEESGFTFYVRTESSSSYEIYHAC